MKEYTYNDFGAFLIDKAEEMVAANTSWEDPAEFIHLFGKEISAAYGRGEINPQKLPSEIDEENLMKFFFVILAGMVGSGLLHEILKQREQEITPAEIAFDFARVIIISQAMDNIHNIAAFYDPVANTDWCNEITYKSFTETKRANRY